MSLVVYKSSAGSGKTTTLVKEYLKIALASSQSFRHILAITFTNKAANEMKERVIETLENFADPNKKPDGKYKELINELQLDPETLVIRAQTLLSLIIHNYDEFAISTIDSFVHRIIRTFASDVQLPQNFEPVIDEEEIIPEIIQNLYEKVGMDKELTKVLINFVLNEADEENNYDPTNKLTSFIKRHTQEDGFAHISKLDNLNMSELGRIITKIKKRITSDKEKIINDAKACIKLCNDNSLEISDFYGGSRGILTYFIKLSQFIGPDDKLFPGSSIQKTINEDKWYGSKASSAAKSSIDNIKPQLIAYYQQLQKTITNYFFYRLIFSKIYSLALVHEVKQLFEYHTEQTGKVHISEFNKKISKEIANQPIPFIYERLGRKYRYFLIDEFQDTSILQWYNLLPLIEESLSNNFFNMLVGDAKQAIYRFRNGEVELFSQLPELYGEPETDISVSRQNALKSHYNEVILSTNWRSDYEVIKFNNDFFKTITQPLSDRVLNIYSNLEQKIPDHKKHGGLVSINFIEEDDSLNYEREKLLKIECIIEELLKNKFKEEDICILCRTGKNAISIAGFLIDKGYNVVSSESLLLTNSPAVRLIIAFFKLVIYPEDEVAIAEFVRNYEIVVPSTVTFNELFVGIRKTKTNGIHKILSELKIYNTTGDINSLSTYEMAEYVLRNIIHQKSGDIFIQFFLDFIIETRLPLDKFLKRWEEKKSKLFITMPENVEAIQIMTIHKAKGLDFPAVIVDAANNRPQKTKSEYWEDLHLDDIDELKVGLLPIKKDLDKINRAHIYEEEISKTELDFINLIYVAFTRPQNTLFTISQYTGKDKDEYTKLLTSYLISKNIWDPEKLTYNFGDLSLKDDTFDNPPNEIRSIDNYISSDWQKLISVATSEEIIDDQLLTTISPAYYGNLIHRLLSRIYTNNDITKVMEQLYSSGLISNNNIEIIESTLRSVVDHQILRKYFGPELLVKNETELLMKDGNIIRPDRVTITDDNVTIIDYKTGEETTDDIEQVKKYKRAFNELNYNKVDCKLVYIGDTIKVVEIGA